MDMVALPKCELTIKVQKPQKILKKPKTLGEHIKKVRLERNLLQKEVAIIVGVTEQTIYNWENNYSNPRKTFISRIINFIYGKDIFSI